MNYIDFDQYKRKWIFTHQSMPVSAEDRAEIKPMTESRSGQLWQEFISRESPTADHFGNREWPSLDDTWIERINWQQAWDDESDLPQEFLDFFSWEDNVTVYFCYEKTNVIETRWGVFKKYWKNFLFYDDKPILLGRRKQQVAMFEQNGDVKLGMKAKN